MIIFVYQTWAYYTNNLCILFSLYFNRTSFCLLQWRMPYFLLVIFHIVYVWAARSSVACHEGITRRQRDAHLSNYKQRRKHVKLLIVSFDTHVTWHFWPVVANSVCYLHINQKSKANRHHQTTTYQMLRKLHLPSTMTSSVYINQKEREGDNGHPCRLHNLWGPYQELCSAFLPQF